MFVPLVIGLVLVDKVAISLVVWTVLGHSINLSNLTFKVILHLMHIGSNSRKKRIEIEEKIKRGETLSIVLSVL